MAVRLSRNLAAAQDAYAKGSTEQLRQSHSARTGCMERS